MKVFLDESVFGRKCFWMKVFLDEFFFFCNLDESVPNRAGHERHQTKIAFEVELFRNRTCIVCTERPVLLTRLSAIWHAGWERSHGEGQLPRVLQHQRWSPLNVPLCLCCGVQQARRIPRQSLSGWLLVQRPWTKRSISSKEESTPQTPQSGLDSPKGRVEIVGALRVRDDLTQWLRDQRFAGAQPGNHIPARAQEFLFSEACRFDASVALLEAFFVRLTLHMGRQMAVSTWRDSCQWAGSVQVLEADR